MTVYVDHARLAYGRMKMSHLIADTDAELHAMADRIGVARKWHQNTMAGSHYDIALSKRALAIEAGAVEITTRQAAMMTSNRRAGYGLGDPEKAAAVWNQRRADLHRHAESWRQEAPGA